MLGLVARPSLVSLPHTSLGSKADLIVTCKGLSCSSTSMKSVLHRPASTASADIVVSGGGMVGTAAAATIAKLAGMQNKKIILLESSPLKKYSLPQVPSNRVAALSPATVSLLDRLGAWQIIKRMRAQPIKRMKVWESCSDAAIAFGGGEQDEPLAHIVENDLTVNALTEVTQSCSNVDVRYGAKVKSYSIPDLQHSQQVPTSPVKIELENGDEIECELLVGADGGQSLVRKSLGRDKDMLAWQYHQMGLVATLQISSDEANVTAWQRFLPSGPIALLPLGPTSSSLVWTVPKSELQGLLSLGDENFVEAVNLGLTSRLGEQGLALALTKGVQTLLGGEERPNPPTVVNVSQRAAFPLGFGHSPYYVGPRTALVGDSAHRVHPLAGQGANLGFGDVCELADQVQGMILDGAGLGHRDYLKMYESARLQHNVPTMLGIDGLQKLYCNSLPPLVIARSLGLALTAASTPLKKLLQSHAAA